MHTCSISFRQKLGNSTPLSPPWLPGWQIASNSIASSRRGDWRMPTGAGPLRIRSGGHPERPVGRSRVRVYCQNLG